MNIQMWKTDVRTYKETHLPHTVARLVKVHILPIFTEHATGFIGWIVRFIYLELEAGHAVE